MSQTVIRVEGLSKRYRIDQGARHTALRNLLGDAFRAPVRLLTGSSYSSDNDPPSSGSPVGEENIATGSNAPVAANGRSRFIWALKDVNFEVHHGEVVGLIGRNGAGKSTLLKILARITRPTEGHAEIHGRVGSLLEVGTGFHGELTGRENVYMSGAILGMRKAEIDRKFDEIVAFSEVERFLDTPLKHYSSGMQMRLAFAVAAHLEPEILLVDEVLAVGDANFQKKCLGKMSDISRQGRTIMFVSHNVAAVMRLCSRCLVISGGNVAYDGDTHTAISQYYMPIEAATVNGSYVAAARGTRPHLASAFIETSDPGGEHGHGKPITFEFLIAVPTPCQGLCFSFQVVNEDSVPICHFWVLNSEYAFGATPGIHRLRCEVKRPRLFMGTYSLTTWLADRRGSDTLIESLQGICQFRINMFGATREQYDWRRGQCVYLEDSAWNVELDVPEHAQGRHA
jgi:lipopolysaccharide transport system ATP-binding protein